MPGHRDTLRARARQPGHDRGWVSAETDFVTAATALLPDHYTVEAQPADLRAFYTPGPGRPLGLMPDAKITNNRTGRYMYVEVKRQGENGNAEERAYRHHTTKFARHLAEHTDLPYHAYVSVFCDELATLRRYRVKIAAHIEDGHYLFWAGYDPFILAGFLDDLRRAHLDTDQDAPSCADAATLLAANAYLHLPIPPPQAMLFDDLPA